MMKVSIQIMKSLAALLVLLNCAGLVHARVLSAEDKGGPGLLERRFLYLIDSPAVILDYHNGPILTGSNGSICVYLIWYGSFNETDKSTIRDYFNSFQAVNGTITDVSRWWNTTAQYTDESGRTAAASVVLAGEVDDTSYSKGKILQNADVDTIVLNSLSTFSANSQAIYFVLASADVIVDDYCRAACASHSFTGPATAGGHQLPYAWVGNSKDQCPGLCAWPFARPSYMPAYTELVIPPNGNVGVDGMIIQISNMLAGAATNPFDTAYYQGDPTIPLEAATACYGFGVGAFEGYPGILQRDPITGAQYNAVGINNRKFLLPTLWDPLKRVCSPIAFAP